jgi:hypothetical protein
MDFFRKLFKKKETVIETYQDFWHWFQQNEKQFFKATQTHKDVDRDALGPIMEKLQMLGDCFYCQLGMENDDTADLVITAEGDIKSFVFVDELIAAAPKIEGWTFTNLKPANGLGFNIGMGDYSFSDETISFYENVLPQYPDEIDITLVHKDFNEDNKKLIIQGSFIYLETILGEYDAATIIDSVNVKGIEKGNKTLIPIEKLRDFLIWREKEFVEKYKGFRKSEEEGDEFRLLEAETKEGYPILAAINHTLLQWDAQPSHQWFLVIEAAYDGKENNGLPNKKMHELLNQFEDEIIELFQDTEGYLNLGRETGMNTKKLFFACKEFKNVSKMTSELIKKYESRLPMTYDIYKDKYWMTLNRFK